MKNLKIMLLTLAVVFSVSVRNVTAGPILSLATSDDLANLAPGQTITIDAVLSGLNPGDELEFLAATAIYDDLVLGTPTITAGSIVPEVGDFTATELPGLADGLSGRGMAALHDAGSGGLVCRTARGRRPNHRRRRIVGGHGDLVWETGKFNNPPERDLETWFIRGGSAGGRAARGSRPSPRG